MSLLSCTQVAQGGPVPAPWRILYCPWPAERAATLIALRGLEVDWYWRWRSRLATVLLSKCAAVALIREGPWDESVKEAVAGEFGEASFCD